MERELQRRDQRNTEEEAAEEAARELQKQALVSASIATHQAKRHIRWRTGASVLGGEMACTADFAEGLPV